MTQRAPIEHRRRAYLHLRKLSVVERFWVKVVKGPGCWEWQGTRTIKGYGSAFNGSKMQQAHRFSWELAHGAITDGRFVLHRCDNPPCVNPEHLFLGSNQDNIDDRVRKGRSARTRGEAHGGAKLNENDVIDIRTVYALGGRIYQIAKAYGVTPSMVGFIVHRKNWRHLP